MDANTAMTIISTVGFPICMCGVMAWFIKFLMDKHSEETKELRDVIVQNTQILEGLKQLIADHLNK